MNKTTEKPSVKFFENDQEFSILETKWESELDSKIKEIETYVVENNGKGKSESEKDLLYKRAQDMWKEFASLLTETKYNFFLNRRQYKFLTDLIISNLEYDVNTIFFAIELTDLLGKMKEDSNYTNDTDLISFPVNATEITYIYHLISNHKVRGLNKKSYLFAEVLRKIGEISKIFNYYDISGKRLSTSIQDWVVTFEDGVTSDTDNLIEGNVI